MDTQKLLIIAGIGLGLYLLTTRQANAAQRGPIAPGANAAPTGPGAAARNEAAQFADIGRGFADMFGSIGRAFRTVGQSRTDTGDETGRLAGRYPAPPVTDTGDETERLAARYPVPDDAVPINTPGNQDVMGVEDALFGRLSGISPNWSWGALGL